MDEPDIHLRMAATLAALLARDSSFAALVEALPHPLAIYGLKLWGSLRGLYPGPTAGQERYGAEKP